MDNFNEERKNIKTNSKRKMNEENNNEIIQETKKIKSEIDNMKQCKFDDTTIFSILIMIIQQLVLAHGIETKNNVKFEIVSQILDNYMKTGNFDNLEIKYVPLNEFYEVHMDTNINLTEQDMNDITPF